MLEPDEFLSPFGVRSLSRRHATEPFVFRWGDLTSVVDYQPGESTTPLFGGNSNWRGPVWFPLNHLAIEALHRFARFFGDGLEVECPTGSDRFVGLAQVASDLAERLVSLFLPGPDGVRPAHGPDWPFAGVPGFDDVVVFHEYFHGDTGRGLGASHQTGWTALVADLILGRSR